MVQSGTEWKTEVATLQTGNAAGRRMHVLQRHGECGEFLSFLRHLHLSPTFVTPTHMTLSAQGQVERQIIPVNCVEIEM